MSFSGWQNIAGFPCETYCTTTEFGALATVPYRVYCSLVLNCPRSILLRCVAKFGGIKVEDPVTKPLCSAWIVWIL